MTSIHPTAIIDPTATIGESVEIGPYCVIGPDVVIGEGCSLQNHVTVAKLTTLGRGNTIYPYSVIGADPQDLKFRGEHAICEIGDHNTIREHVTVHRGTANGGGVTRIGSHNLIMVAVHVAHDCILEDDIIIANQVMLAGHVLVQRGANIGGGAGVHHFTTIGECALVGGLARINRDVPPFMVVEGNPAEVRKTNNIAMSRLGYEQAHIDAVKEAFKFLYRDNGAPIAAKLDDLRQRFVDVAAISKLCDALSASAGGVYGRARENQRLDDKWETRET
jgi:UDP-N-acetylglucosamine acyltransferase